MNRSSALFVVWCMVLSQLDTPHPSQVQAFHILSRHRKTFSFHKNTNSKANHAPHPNTNPILNTVHNLNEDKNSIQFISTSKYQTTSKRRKFKTVLASLAIYSTVLLRTPNIANADHPLENSPTGRISLKPGATVESIQQEMELRKELTIEELAIRSTAAAAASSSSSTSSNSHTPSSHPSKGTSKQPQQKQKQQKQQKQQQNQDDNDDEYESFEDDDMEPTYSSSSSIDGGSITSSNIRSISSSAMDLTNSNVAKTVTKFSGSAPVMSSKTKNQQVAKTVVKIMGPIFVFCFARETIRWNREQRNVDKGIEIMEQQRREYLNMKKEEDDEDDDDDDDENDDDDDDDEDDDDDDDDDEE